MVIFKLIFYSGFKIVLKNLSTFFEMITIILNIVLHDFLFEYFEQWIALVIGLLVPTTTIVNKLM